MSNAVEWIIAGAAVANLIVYVGLWLEARKQIALTRDLFVESHKPVLSVSLVKCEHVNLEQSLKMRIVVKNHGTVAANDVKLHIAFGGSNAVKDIGRIAIQPQNKIVYTFSMPMTSENFHIGQTVGNRLNALIEGSYKGLSDQSYPYRERQEYDPDLNRFVPTTAW